MSGAAGHLMHLHEDRELTFGELKMIVKGIVTGDIELFEKCDGLNLMFQWRSDELFVARNKTDLLNGGMNRQQLLVKFEDRGSLQQAFLEGYDALKSALSNLDMSERFKLLPSSTWLSVEIISSKNRNLLHYDHDHLVIHRYPIYVNDNGLLKLVKDDQLVDQLTSKLKDVDGWKISGPVRVEFDYKPTSGYSRIVHSTNLKDNLTFGEHLRDRLVTMMLDLPYFTARNLAGRILELPGHPTVNEIKQSLPSRSKFLRSRVSEYSLLRDQLIKSAESELQTLIHDFACELLTHVKSAFISDHKAEIERLRRTFRNAVLTIHASNDQKLLNEMNSQLGKVRDHLISPIEGVVFEWNGKYRKLTGNFSMLNRIVGLLRYGQEEAKKREETKTLERH